METNYLNNIESHARECAELLDELRLIKQTRNLTHIEFAAAERSLQSLAESGIGCAKRWLKSLGYHVPNNAYSSFEKLRDLQLIDSKICQSWRSIVGLRNTIVHDYMDVDAEIINSVLLGSEYNEVLAFITLAKNGWGKN